MSRCTSSLRASQSIQVFSLETNTQLYSALDALEEGLRAASAPAVQPRRSRSLRHRGGEGRGGAQEILRPQRVREDEADLAGLSLLREDGGGRERGVGRGVALVVK